MKRFRSIALRMPMSSRSISSVSWSKRSPSTLQTSAKLSQWSTKPIWRTHSRTSSADQWGTFWLSLCGISSPINRSVWAAYLDAMALGDEATDLSGSMAPISQKMSVLPWLFWMIPASMQKWKAAKFRASSLFEFKTGTNRLSQLLDWPRPRRAWCCHVAATVLANSLGLWVETNGSTKFKVTDWRTVASISLLATKAAMARQA